MPRGVTPALWRQRPKVTLLNAKSSVLGRGHRRPGGVGVTGGASEPSWPSIPAMLAGTEARLGHLPALRDGGTELTYAQLAAEARRLAAALVSTGVGVGDRVALWSGNGAEWVVAALGVFAAGAVLVPVNTRWKGAEAADVLARSRARVLFTMTDFLGTDYVAMLEGTGIELPDLETIVTTRGAPSGRALSWAGSPGGPRPSRWPRWDGAAPPSVPRTPRTSSSPRGPPATPRGWS